MSENPTLAVIGGTGYAGGHITREAVARGYGVTVVSRHDPADAAPGVTYVRGEISDEDLLRRLAKDHDVVAIAVSAASTDLLGAMPVIAEAVDAGSARLAVVGGAGSLVAPGGGRLVDSPDFPAAFRPEALAHADVLTWLQKNGDGIDWVYLSPAVGFGSFAPGERTGTYRTGDDTPVFAEDGSSQISGADYALAFVDELASHRHVNRRFTVGY
ncbi:NAD-dependent epimerase/dehydratase family protein [Rhodococcus rhodnii]|uniref:NAD(P)-binding domain-containing protein n=2 Tax=Rhodococcus rhodnii TaxID=38312 RepID=R7WHU2_9NOCA|nr:NAD(P)H-binding protein [Rhodococcus rhodnii]EOM74770.1 hypothetical protein Rrhod_3933 [Rhodococcus rhodnii LMG 5362]TXG89864.1 NAD-dependent epimerase/dehydratase family protein [Rhodococcus rhodnii]